MLEKLLLWLLRILTGRIERKIATRRLTEKKAQAFDRHIESLKKQNRELRKVLHARDGSNISRASEK